MSNSLYTYNQYSPVTLDLKWQNSEMVLIFDGILVGGASPTFPKKIEKFRSVRYPPSLRKVQKTVRFHTLFKIIHKLMVSKKSVFVPKMLYKITFTVTFNNIKFNSLVVCVNKVKNSFFRIFL